MGRSQRGVGAIYRHHHLKDLEAGVLALLYMGLRDGMYISGNMAGL
jgi:hypothetical protein